MSLWQHKEQMLELLMKFVRVPSITGSKEEIKIVDHIMGELRKLTYFQENRCHLQTHAINNDRKLITALVKNNKESKDTILLINHFDVVGVQDYGELKELAFHPEEITNTFYKNKESLSVEVKDDIECGNWLFGRGTMDMKAGLVLHMSMLEKASLGEFDGNILMVSVPDEEGSSLGMRSAVPIIKQLAKEFDLEYKACLNSEPVFASFSGDRNNYISSGSIGKINVGFLCYGKETHVGEPLSGLNANLMASQITCALEINNQFTEQVAHEVTPVPSNIHQRDLKEDYSAQIPHCAVTMFNFFVMEKPVHILIQELCTKVEDIVGSIEQRYKRKIQVCTYEQLYEIALSTHGEKVLQELEERVLEESGELDHRSRTIKIVDRMAQLCQQEWPMVILFITPPFYPSISSRDTPIIKDTIEKVLTYAKKTYNINLKHQYYFPGVSDLSYVALDHRIFPADLLKGNTPLWDKTYSLPLKEMEELQLPVINFGPIGRDAHKYTERLDIDYIFGAFSKMLPFVIQRLLNYSP